MNLLVQPFFNKHIGIYGFQKEVLFSIARLPPSQLEIAESLEQLRWLENGISIGVEITNIESIGIDVPEDLLQFQSENPITKP